MTVHFVPLCPLPKRSASVGAEQVQVHIPLCEEVVQITPNQHVLCASHNLEYYWCQSQGLFRHVSCVSYSYGDLPLTCVVVKCKCTFMKLKCNNCLSKSCTVPPCFTCVPGCMHVCTAQCIAGSVHIVLFVCVCMYVWIEYFCYFCSITTTTLFFLFYLGYVTYLG